MLKKKKKKQTRKDCKYNACRQLFFSKSTMGQNYIKTTKTKPNWTLPLFPGSSGSRTATKASENLKKSMQVVASGPIFPQNNDSAWCCNWLVLHALWCYVRSTSYVWYLVPGSSDVWKIKVCADGVQVTQGTAPCLGLSLLCDTHKHRVV